MSDARAPVFIEALLDDPSVFRGLVERHAPYWPVQRYFANDAEYRMSSGSDAPMIVAPNFRGDWAYDRPLVEGAELFLDHPRLREAAGALFETDRVRPQIVYTNLTWQLPFHQGGGHTDVPAFRGVDRTRYPVWILQAMGHSRLFEAERIQIATAVAWFYEGKDGGFEYWPGGPEGASRIHEGDVYNTAIVGDNDRMYHRVRPVGRREDGLLAGLTLDARLEHVEGDGWRISESGDIRAAFGYDALRISVSWKARVFRDAAEERIVLEGRNAISIDQALERFYQDLEERGEPFDRSAEPMTDPALAELLGRVYVREPARAD